MALVFWEILSRTALSAEHEPLPYRVPYSTFNETPTVAQMKQLIAVENVRPQFDVYEGRLLI